MTQILILAIVISCAVAAIFLKDLLNATIALAGFSLIISLLFYILHAPDVALTEAAVGAGISTVIFVLTVNKIKIYRGDDENE